MRANILAASVILLGGSRLPAQNDLDRHLAGWEQSMKQTKSLSLKFDMVRTDAVFKKQRKSTGRATLMQPNLCLLGIMGEDGTFERDIYNGNRDPN